MRDLNLLLEFDAQYRRDRQQGDAFLHRRDRRFTLETGIDGSTDPAAWLRAVRGGAANTPRTPAMARTKAWLRARLAFAAAGAVLGATTMFGLLYYTGGQRINVTLIIAVAFLQLVLTLATGVQALAGWQPWRPLLAALQRMLARGPTGDDAYAITRQLAAPRAAGVVQTGGLAFALAALVALLTQVVIHDLAFGWSTTLQASAPAYHALTTGLAWPWHAWWPSAVPSLALVEQSRFFRLAGEGTGNVALLGGWWPFLIAVWLHYAVLLRLLGLALAHVQLRLCIRRSWRAHPGRHALHLRCTTPWVDSGNAADATPPPPLPVQIASTPDSPARVLIRWAGAGSAHGRFNDGTRILEAGGSATLQEDRRTLQAARDANGAILVVVRGWEPPTGELTDFLSLARETCGAVPIRLLPLAASGGGETVTGTRLAQWQRYVERLAALRIALTGPPAAGASA